MVNNNNRYGKNQLFALGLVLKLQGLFDCFKFDPV